MPDLVALEPFADFATAANAALAFLQAQLGMGLWMMTRATADDWIVLGISNAEKRYQVQRGDVFRWSDTLCARMVTGAGPHIAPRAADIDAYRTAPICQQLAVGAYVGLPLRTEDGALFGTLCAIDPHPQEMALLGAEPLLTLTGRLLATVLNGELRLAADMRRIERAEAEAMLDELTGLGNRRAWDLHCEREEARCRRYGHSACVISIDLDGLKTVNDAHGHAAGDALVIRASQALRQGVREQDIVARVGGDEFAALLVECEETDGRVVLERLREHLAEAQIKASIGFARRDPQRDIKHAWDLADARMYEEKRQHHAHA